MESKFLYYINPRKPIKNLNNDLRLIRTPHTYYLNKEEVLKILDKAFVYRRFCNEDKYIKVSKYNLDRLHNEKFISEEEWVPGEKVVVIEPKKNNDVIIKDEVDNAVVENTVEEVVSDEDEKVEDEISTAEETVVENTVEEVVSDEDEKVEDEISTEETDVEDTKTEVIPKPMPKVNYNNYNKKKH